MTIRISTDRLYRWTLIGLISGLAIVYFVYAERHVPPWDPAAMALMGRSLFRSEGVQFYDANNAIIGPYFNPHGFNTRPPFDPQPYASFPPGFSLIEAFVYKLTGSPDRLYVIPPIFGLASLVAVAYIGHVLSGRWGSILAVMLVGTSQVVATFSTTLWSDGPSLSLLLVAIALYIAADTLGNRALALLSGLCLGLFILLKFVNVVFAVLILIHRILTGDGQRRWVTVGPLSIGIILGIAGMLAYQAQAYGHPLANAYQAWGRSVFGFPLFSLQYLFSKSPAPWNDISVNAIVSGLLTDMHVWSLFFMAGLMVDRRNPYRLLLAFIVLFNIVLYAVSVFTTRQFINMRYMLPALAAGYILAADALAHVMLRLPAAGLRVTLAGLVAAISLVNMLGYLPDLAHRNQGTAAAVQNVIQTAKALPMQSVVLAYNLVDTFILYGDKSVLNYRHIDVPDLATRNRIVVQAIDRLLCRSTPVYLVKDDERLFQTLYPDLLRKFRVTPIDAPITSYEIQPISDDARCASSE